jgi:hypothetical protein
LSNQELGTDIYYFAFEAGGSGRLASHQSTDSYRCRQEQAIHHLSSTGSCVRSNSGRSGKDVAFLLTDVNIYKYLYMYIYMSPQQSRVSHQRVTREKIRPHADIIENDLKKKRKRQRE